MNRSIDKHDSRRHKDRQPTVTRRTDVPIKSRREDDKNGAQTKKKTVREEKWEESLQREFQG